MILIKKTSDLNKLLSQKRSLNLSTGFVPTMGALHAGHISLIKKCGADNDISICSIFINPTQFNNKADFHKYPVTIEKDVEMLEQAGCDVLFIPSADEMYPPDEIQEHYELGYLENILEGEYRPGHFQGVCMIVDKLLTVVNPDTLYLGKKDYQQCMIIKKMAELKGHTVKIITGETLREIDGLAMSSRNMRFNANERANAVNIFKALTIIKDEIAAGDFTMLKKKAVNFLVQKGFKVDYIEIADAQTLMPQKLWDGKMKMVVLAAAYLNEIRLIDNISL
jgi:pantoate--beta-alanine ligase